MAAMKTPGVYIVEKNAFPNSVVEVATAVPAFIGYTQIARDGNTSLINKPWRITSMAEFRTYFGEAPVLKFAVKANEAAEEAPAADAETEAEEIKPAALDSFEIGISPKESYTVTPPEHYYTLFYHMLLFYANGGGPCYIVSVGNYDTAPDSKALANGLTFLIKEQEPTLVVIPEAVNFKQQECADIQTAMLSHCGDKMRNRFAILDVWNGTDLEKQKDIITQFREKVGSNFLAYCASYFPWIETSIITDREIDYQNLDWDLFTAAADEKTPWPAAIKEVINTYAESLKAAEADEEADETQKEEKIKTIKGDLHSILVQNWSLYKYVLTIIKDQMNRLPPSAAIAGVYTMVDNLRGVWKAPANVSINNVIKPSTNLTNEEQEDLNVPLTGKAVNAIRSFIGEGIKIWGARTMDGNSLDWRYINVRRTMIFLEESIKNAARAYVFEPNNASTWLNMKGMIENFLKGVWKRGGLAGASPEDAFSVHVGLGDTMTPEDILEGILRITVLVAITHPAEFIEITFQQQMQKS